MSNRPPDPPKPRDPAPYVEEAKRVVAEESVTLAPMTFHLSRSKCPHCGEEVTVELSRVEPVGGKVVAMPEGPKP
jgi:hypothetical protein